MALSLHPDDPAWRQLELAFIKAQKKAIDGITARLSGDEVATPEVAPANSETLISALETWATGGGRAARRPRENSIAEARRAVQRFVELHGNLPLHTITKVHGRQFRDALAKIPKRLPHSLAKLRLPDLLKRNLSKYPTRNAQTVNKNLNLVAGILAKAEKEGHFEQLSNWSNPFHIGFDISQMEREHYEPFTIDELNALLRSPVFLEGQRPIGGRGEAAFWFPIVALFTGARRTEIAQLKLGDIRQASGIHFIDFNDEGNDQNLKNLSSARSVPIHRKLIEIGFLDYVDRRSSKTAAAAALWPEFEPPIGPKAKLWSKWFADTLAYTPSINPRRHSIRFVTPLSALAGRPGSARRSITPSRGTAAAALAAVMAEFDAAMARWTEGCLWND